MPGISERVYPDDMDCGGAVQGTLQKVFRERYNLALGWLAQHFASGTNGPGSEDFEPPREDRRLLDIASGSGFGSAILAGLGRVVGVDIDPAAVEYATSRYGRFGVSFCAGDANDRSFLESLGRFDGVVSLATIEHLRDPRSFLDWMCQALLPGGACVLGFPANFTRDWAAPHHRWDISPRKAQRLFAEHLLLIRRCSRDGVRLRIGDLMTEARVNQDLPVPPLLQWIRYYLGHPHHFLVRLYQITVGSGILFASQQYLLEPGNLHAHGPH